MCGPSAVNPKQALKKLDGPVVLCNLKQKSHGKRSFQQKLEQPGKKRGF